MGTKRESYLANNITNVAANLCSSAGALVQNFGRPYHGCQRKLATWANFLHVSNERQMSNVDFKSYCSVSEYVIFGRVLSPFNVKGSS